MDIFILNNTQNYNNSNGVYNTIAIGYLLNAFANFSANTIRFHISNGSATIEPQKYSSLLFSMANTITTMHIIMHTMWLMKFRIPMYFFIVDFSYSNETFNAKFFIVIIGGMTVVLSTSLFIFIII